MKIAAVLFLLLAVMAFEAAGAEGLSDRPMKEIDAGEILEKIQEGQPVEYDHVVVRGDLDLSRGRLQKNVTSPIRINDSIFKGLVSFNGSTIEMPIDVSGSNFSRKASFMLATFSDTVHLRKATFSNDANFLGATFNSYAEFMNSTFISEANFLGTTFRGEAYFMNSTFRSEAQFLYAIFSGNADFKEATFRGKAGFFGTTLSSYAGFEKATFIGESCFMEATFLDNAYFWDAIFGGDANFMDATLRSKAYFYGTTFREETYFDGATFSGGADFSGASLFGNSSFDDAEFDGNIEFGDARFENETSFYRILFKRPAYFENCSIKSLNLIKAEYNRLHLRWGDIKSLHFDDATYLALIKNYNTLGWYGDANDCYYDYRNAVRRSWQAPSSGFAARLSSLLDRLVDFGEWILYGYGVRPSFPIAWSVLIILAFGLFFRQKRSLRKIITEEKIEDAGDGSDEVLVESKARKAPINSLDPFLFSLFTFTSGFTAFLQPAVEYKLERCLRWAIAERLLGPFFLALVITTISKTYLIR